MTLQKTLDLYEEYLRLQREIGRLLGKVGSSPPPSPFPCWQGGWGDALERD